MGTPTRDEIIAGLRELIDFLADNPEIPLTPWSARISQPVDRGASDDDGMAELHRVARLLDVAVDNKHGSETHWYATRRFGPAMYEASYILRSQIEERAAGGGSDA